MQNDDSAGKADGAAGEGDQHGLGEQLAQDEPAAGAEGEAKSDFLGAVGGAGGEEAAEIGAGGEQNQSGEQHEAGHEGAGRAAEHIADQAGAGQGEFDAIVVAGIGFGQPVRRLR